MQRKATATSHKALFLNTLAFAVCFAAWMLNGVLVTFLSANEVFDWGPVEIGWLMGIPVLTGSLFRLPAGMLTDRFGGKPVYGTLLLLCAVPMYLLSYANSFLGFALCSFGFGLSGASFAIGIAFTSVWYPRESQGTALGIFGVGNIGAAGTTLLAPTLLNHLTSQGTHIEGWRTLPMYYAVMLAAMGVLFFLFAENKKPAQSAKRMSQLLSPLKDIRVWRFGLYYFLLFGCFVAFSQWLVPYFVNAYYLPLVTAGILAASFSLPSGVTRALGGWASDALGARKVMYWVLGASVLISLLLTVPKMEIYSPGRGIMAARDGRVSEVSESGIVVDGRRYLVLERPTTMEDTQEGILVLPTRVIWQEPVVAVGQRVHRRELLAKGVTRIFFQANVWIFAALVILLGCAWGIGMAAVYKHIPDYFPEEVGVVGGMVGVLGGLGGFVCPILFGYLLEWTGLWTSAWMLMLALSMACYLWMHRTVMRLSRPPGGFEAKFAGLLRAGGRDFLKPLLTWNEELSVGIGGIDRQHRRLMRLINEIDERVQGGGSYEQIAPVLGELVDYARVHFSSEEGLLEENHCPDIAGHKKAHRRLLQELVDWKEKAEQIRGKDLEDHMDFLRIWFPGHILAVDRRDAAYLSSAPHR